MNTKFTLALLATAVMGRRGKNRGNHGLGVNDDTTEFQEFIGKFGKSYTSVGQMNDRLSIWRANKLNVDHLNASNAGTGVVFGMNETGDMTEEEFLQRQGLVKPWNFDELKSSDSHSSRSQHHRSGRLGADQSISWVDRGKVHPVKNQGGCGSCWAFAAATVQETMQAIKNETGVVRLSE